jgi:AraC-like DNA-binding protein
MEVGAALRGLVAYHGYDVVGSAPGTHRGLPSPYLTLVVAVDDTLAMAGPDGTVRYDTVLGGLHTEAVTIVHDGRQRGVHVVVDPLAARTLFGTPAAALERADLDATAVLGPLAVELHERVNAAGDGAARSAVLDDVLLRRVRRVGEPPAVRDELRWAWRRLVGGGSGVRDVAGEVGWSERHLERRFRAEFGVGPKALGRMARFDRVRRRLAGRATAGVPLGLAELAVDGGYADQAHLTREFGALAGCSPTRWVAEEVGNLVEVGNVQDAGPPRRPSSSP